MLDVAAVLDPPLDKSGGLLVYVKSNIPTKKLIIPDCPSNIHMIPVDIILRNRNGWLEQYMHHHLSVRTIL